MFGAKTVAIGLVWALQKTDPRVFMGLPLQNKKMEKAVLQWWPPKLLSPFCASNPEIIEIKVYHRQTATNYLTPFLWVCEFFISVEFATSPLASLAGENTQCKWYCMLSFEGTQTKSKFKRTFLINIYIQCFEFMPLRLRKIMCSLHEALLVNYFLSASVWII